MRAVGQERLRPQRSPCRQPIDQQHLKPGRTVILVARVFGHVNVNAGLKFVDQLGKPVQRLVVQRERGMRPDESSEDPIALICTRLQETPILFETRLPTGRAMPVGRLVAQHAAQPDAGEPALYKIERIADAMRYAWW